MKILWIISFVGLALAGPKPEIQPQVDLGCDGSQAGNGASAIGCVQNGCCEFDFQVGALCEGNYVCCYSRDTCANQDIEFRGVWVSTVYNIDWPRSSGLSTSAAQAELREVVDNVVDLNMNAIFFQVRPNGDAMYSSTLEPWSRWLTGTEGVAPNPIWDPLQYLIDYAKPKGIQVHAWFNPYRANTSPTTVGLASNNMCLKYRAYCYVYGQNMWMDPGSRSVESYVASVIVDVVNRYDIDGVHIDDYFYPYPITGTPFPDAETYRAYQNNGGTLGLEDWRRSNTDHMVERLWNNIKAAKPSVQFSISPFGIYRPCHSSGMPCSIQGLDQYSQLYADPKKWLQEQWCDFMLPQLYWQIDPPAQSYPVLLDWWTGSNANPHGIKIYAGNAAYKCQDNNWAASEIQRQVDISRNSGPASLGNAMFSYKQFRDNVKGLRDAFKANQYKDPAQPPVI